MLTEADFRLPRTVVPQHYTITVEPDLESFTFKGSEVVDLDVEETVDAIVLNALDLVIVDGELVQPQSGRRLGVTVSSGSGRRSNSPARPSPARGSCIFNGPASSTINCTASTAARTNSNPARRRSSRRPSSSRRMPVAPSHVGMSPT